MDPTDITHRILEQIQAELPALRGEVRDNGRRIEENGRRIEENGRRIDEVTGRLRVVERRIGDLVDITGRSVARQIDLGERVQGLEDRVDALERRGT
jgi:chromosome segregation ATPase